MGRRKKKDSVSGYFRTVFADRPDWLGEKSNDAILARYREDHGMAPGAEIDKNIKANLANLKSVLRGKRKLRKRRKQAESANGTTAAVSSVRLASSPRSLKELDQLEYYIDEALALAKHLDREGLDDIVRLLRAARNRVIIRIGQE